ncbi:unannotated protein [freshwater metagenome]|uniref:Unannotated protein n=1 Tax=freshwater metagenome TaxID=449393 RepID=A0A6J7D0J0_9ZZZZ
MHRIVLDTAAETDLFHHLEIVGCAHSESLCLEELVLAFEYSEPVCQFGFDVRDGALHRFGARGVVRCREDAHRIHCLDDLTGERVQLVQCLNLVAEHFYSDRQLFILRDDFERVATHAKFASTEVDIVALVLHSDESTDDIGSTDCLADLKSQHRIKVFLRRAKTVDARHR